MDWCIESYENANHNPVAVINGDSSNNILIKSAKTGESLKFDASSSSDPDGDKISYRWYNYKEAGTYKFVIKVENPISESIEFRIPEDAGGSEIHLILEIQDKNAIASLFDYRRIVVVVD
jgi:hypothetical protein